MKIKSFPDPKVEAWESRTEMPLTSLAVLFLAVFAASILWTDLPPALKLIFFISEVAMWSVFVFDYLGRLFVSNNRFQFIRTHWFDLLVVLLPMSRPLRMLRLVFLLRWLNVRAKVNLRGQIVTYVVGAATIVTFVGALAILDAERGQPGAQINNFGDALWWSCVTITTVGYGDLTPVTTLGRVVAVGMMIFGMALLGSVTATLASWIVEQVSEADATEQTDLPSGGSQIQVVTEIRQLQTEIKSLKESLAASRAGQEGRDQ